MQNIIIDKIKKYPKCQLLMILVVMKQKARLRQLYRCAFLLTCL